MRGSLRVGLHPDRGEGVVHTLLELCTLHAEVRGPERHVVVHGRHEQLVIGILEDDADPPTDLLQVRLRHRQPVTRHLALARKDAVEVQHERRLPGAVRPEQRHPLAFLDREIDTSQRDVAVRIGESDASYLESDGHCIPHATAGDHCTCERQHERHQPSVATRRPLRRGRASSPRIPAKPWRGTHAPPLV